MYIYTIDYYDTIPVILFFYYLLPRFRFFQKCFNNRVMFVLTSSCCQTLYSIINNLSFQILYYIKNYLRFVILKTSAFGIRTFRYELFIKIFYTKFILF